MKRIKRILKVLIPLFCVCLIAFVVLHLTPELSIKADMIKTWPTSTGSLIAHDWYFDKSPKYVHNLIADKYEGKGTLYRVGIKNYAGYSYFLVKEYGPFYFARYLGGA